MHKDRNRNWLTWIGVIIILVILTAACGTQALQQPSGEGDTGAGQTQSDGDDTNTSRSDEGEDAAGDSNEPLKTYDSGPGALVYDHQFNYNLNMGTTSLSMTTEVSGGVNFNITQTASGMVDIPSQNQLLELPYFRVDGSGNVPITGTFSFITDEDSCSCEFNDTMQVSISGLTHWKPNEVGNVEWKLNLELSETWYADPQWNCKCSEPEMGPIARMNMEQIPAWQPEGLTDKTLEFLYHCDGMYITEDFQGAGGTGSYRWTYRRSNPIEYEFSALPKDVYDEKQFPQGQLLCSDKQGMWGPPLGSLEPIVATWHEYP